MRGRKWPEATKAARVESMRGFRHTDASRQRIKDAIAHMTPEAVELRNRKIGEANKTSKSPEGIKNIVEAAVRRLKDPSLAEQRRQASLKSWETRRANLAQKGNK